LTARLEDTPVLDDEILAEMTGGSGEEVVEALVEGFLDEVEGRVGAFDQALAGDDVNAMGFQAHALKSVSRTYGAMRLGALAERLEKAARNDDCASVREDAGSLSEIWRSTSAAFRTRFLSG